MLLLRLVSHISCCGVIFYTKFCHTVEYILLTTAGPSLLSTSSSAAHGVIISINARGSPNISPTTASDAVISSRVTPTGSANTREDQITKTHREGPITIHPIM